MNLVIPPSMDVKFPQWRKTVCFRGFPFLGASANPIPTQTLNLLASPLNATTLEFANLVGIEIR